MATREREAGHTDKVLFMKASSTNVSAHLSGQRREHAFELTGGSLALDFANTLDDRRRKRPREHIRDFADLLSWGRQAGAVNSAQATLLLRTASRNASTAQTTLRRALDRAVEQGLPYLILDGTLVSSDRCADKKTSRKGKEIDRWYSGKAHEPAGNVQALAAPGGVPLWVSDVLPGSTHDLTAARELVLPQARPYLKDLPILADSGYEGAGAGVHVPVKKPARGELDIDTKTRNALLRSLRYQGERGFALMSQRWRAIQHVSLSPTTIGDIVKSALVLTQFEHKMIN